MARPVEIATFVEVTAADKELLEEKNSSAEALGEAAIAKTCEDCTLRGNCSLTSEPSARGFHSINVDGGIEIDSRVMAFLCYNTKCPDLDYRVGAAPLTTQAAHRFSQQLVSLRRAKDAISVARQKFEDITL